MLCPIGPTCSNPPYMDIRIVTGHNSRSASTDAFSSHVTGTSVSPINKRIVSSSSVFSASDMISSFVAAVSADDPASCISAEDPAASGRKSPSSDASTGAALSACTGTGRPSAGLSVCAAQPESSSITAITMPIAFMRPASCRVLPAKSQIRSPWGASESYDFHPPGGVQRSSDDKMPTVPRRHRGSQNTRRKG